MNKHDELTARLDKLLEHFYSPYSPELISIHNKDEWSVTGRGITDARNLLQLYGDALVRLGDDGFIAKARRNWIYSDKGPTGVEFYDEVYAMREYAQTTVEGE